MEASEEKRALYQEAVKGIPPESPVYSKSS
jgi:hypothetical protein